MVINCFALFVNFFALSPKIEKDYDEYYILTDNGYHIYENSNGSMTGGNAGFLQDTNKFWPFINFEVYNPFNKKDRFRGIIDGYDHFEFIGYSFLIFGLVYVRKVW